jgi:hypothetical protein
MVLRPSRATLGTASGRLPPRWNAGTGSSNCHWSSESARSSPEAPDDRRGHHQANADSLAQRAFAPQGDWRQVRLSNMALCFLLDT